MTSELLHQDVLIMSTNCEQCGYKDNEVKSGSAISDKGQKITLNVEDRDDLSRDILKVHFAALSPCCVTDMTISAERDLWPTYT